MLLPDNFWIIASIIITVEHTSLTERHELLFLVTLTLARRMHNARPLSLISRCGTSCANRFETIIASNVRVKDSARVETISYRGHTSPWLRRSRSRVPFPQNRNNRDGAPHIASLRLADFRSFRLTENNKLFCFCVCSSADACSSLTLRRI